MNQFNVSYVIISFLRYSQIFQRKLVELLILIILFNEEVRISYGSIMRSAADYNGPNSPSSGIAELNVKKPSSGGSGEIVKSNSFNFNEPSCEELRAMWQFSKRQSRASEITNEIPTYHDPFNMNMWEPYYPTATRSLGGYVNDVVYFFLNFLNDLLILFN